MKYLQYSQQFFLYFSFLCFKIKYPGVELFCSICCDSELLCKIHFVPKMIQFLTVLHRHVWDDWIYICHKFLTPVSFRIFPNLFITPKLLRLSVRQQSRFGQTILMHTHTHTHTHTLIFILFFCLSVCFSVLSLIVSVSAFMRTAKEVVACCPNKYWVSVLATV